MITIEFLIQYQETVVETLRNSETRKNMHVEEQILRVLKEHREMELHRNGLVTVQMSPQRFRKISEIY
jgi:hypothetical protein